MNPDTQTQPQPLVTPVTSETAEMVARAMRRCGEDFYQAAQLPTDTRAQQAIRADRLAEIAERRARWWAVLIRYVLSSGSGASWVYASAALTAQRHEESEAKLWRDSATHLRSDAIGVIVSGEAAELGRAGRVVFRSAS